MNCEICGEPLDSDSKKYNGNAHDACLNSEDGLLAELRTAFGVGLSRVLAELRTCSTCGATEADCDCEEFGEDGLAEAIEQAKQVIENPPELFKQWGTGFSLEAPFVTSGSGGKALVEVRAPLGYGGCWTMVMDVDGKQTYIAFGDKTSFRLFIQECVRLL